jgi:nucleotide-binding universal stress UspA family protein
MHPGAFELIHQPAGDPNVFKRILVPFDGSPTSERGLLEAIRLAKDQGARLCILHVIEEYLMVQSAGLDGAGLYAGELLKVLAADSEKVIAKGLRLAGRFGVNAETATVECFSDRSSECIVEEAKKYRADLIVMGTHGRRGVSRLMLGSDAEIVVRTAPAPVLLVRSPEPKFRGRKTAISA